MQKKLIVVSLFNFLVAALMGLTLRYVYINPIDVNYGFLMHAHSHVAMLGWVYLALYVLIVHYFIPDKKPVFTRLFWLTEIAVIGMMLSFPIQGYAAISISFSALHIFCSYYFAYLVWKHHKVNTLPTRYLLKASLIFMLLSTIGVLSLGLIVAKLGSDAALYQIAIQFFLHFQFNGWFLIAVLALFINQFQIQNIKLFKRLFVFLILATTFTLGLPVSWFAYHPFLLIINGFGVLMQLLALWYFIKLIQPFMNNFWSQIPKLLKLMYEFAISNFILKIVLQSASIIPEIAHISHLYRNFVIGFIHLTMLGCVSGFLFAFLLQSVLANVKSTFLNLGIYSFILGFLLTELLLFIQGLLFYFEIGMMPNYYLILFISSIFLPLGIFIFLTQIAKHESKTTKTT